VKKWNSGSRTQLPGFPVMDEADGNAALPSSAILILWLRTV